jgi:ferritin-like metal-binding protein YciE
VIEITRSARKRHACCRQNLDEEKAADQKLTALAERKVNVRAANPPKPRAQAGTRE